MFNESLLILRFSPPMLHLDLYFNQTESTFNFHLLLTIVFNEAKNSFIVTHTEKHK